jgi:MerR family mercuric resistance operon transcriptional regulator
MTETLTIGELAKQGKVNLETIRYYEQQGLIPKPPRLQSGYRSFPVESVNRLRFIKQAQDLGFSLKEVKELLDLQIDPHSTGADVRKRAEAKLADIEAKMKTLSRIKKALKQLTALCSCVGDVLISECPILESLNSEKG